MIVLIWNFCYFCCWCRPCRIWRLHHPLPCSTNCHWHGFLSTACKTLPSYPFIPRNYSQYYSPHQYSNAPPLIHDLFFLPIIKFHSNVNFNVNANSPNAGSNVDWHQNDYAHHSLSSTSYNHYFQYAIIYLRVKVISIVLWSFILLFIVNWLGARFVAGSWGWGVLIWLGCIWVGGISRGWITVGLCVIWKALCVKMSMVSIRSSSTASHYNAPSHTNYTSPQSAPPTTPLTSPSHLPTPQPSSFSYPTWTASTTVHNYNSTPITIYQ